MAKLNYLANVSLDGYIEDPQGSLEWTAPAKDVFDFITELERGNRTHLYGRRMYEALAVWQMMGLEPGAGDGLPFDVHEYAEVWRDSDKIVYSHTLESVSTPRTRLEREFDPAEVRRLKETSEHDLGIAGAAIAQHAFAAELVDDLHLLVYPVVLGGGKPGLPHDVRLDLDLRDQQRFANGTTYLHYAVR